jgi:K+-sensing histidine kinase KdpD
VGLYVARAFAELHGGRIETTNLESGGCEFRLILMPMNLHLSDERHVMESAGSPKSGGSF